MFQYKDKTKFEHSYDVIYLGACPETTCNANYIREAKWPIFEGVKDHNDRDFKSHLLKHTLDNNHQHVFEVTTKIKPTLNIQDSWSHYNYLVNSFNSAS